MGCVSVKKRQEPLFQSTKQPTINANTSDEKDLQILRKPQFNQKFRIIFDEPIISNEVVQKNPQQQIIRQKLKKKSGNILDTKKIYQETLSAQVFYLVDDLPNSLIKNATNAGLKVPRLEKEISRFKSMLPCQQTHSIFVRCDSAKIYSVNALISGSKGTPYAHGLYHFEVNCQNNYPNSPPKVSLLTGRGKVRFNPNLYQNGYVCLSLLGTWAGSGCEQWSPERSSLAQVFLSIQSLIMSEGIYFNQPGFESMKGSLQGELFNVSYSNIVKIANIRYAMIQIIKKPPKGFEAVVKNHFLIKRDEILQDCNLWMEKSNEPFKNCGQNYKIEANMTTADQYSQSLIAAVKQLKEVFQSLEQ